MNKFDWRKPLLFLVIVGLGSCDNMQRKPEPPAPERDVRVGGNEFVMRADLKCPLYVMPAFPDEPELPLDVLKSNPKMTYKELANLEAEHIDKLRAYITKVKKEMKQSNVDYITTCIEENRGRR